MRIEKAYNNVIHSQKCCCADDPAEHGIVVSDDCVLHCVRKSQQYDQIKRVQLCQFAFSCETQRPDQEEVHQNRPDDFFQYRYIRHNQITPQACIHRTLQKEIPSDSRQHWMAEPFLESALIQAATKSFPA